VISLYYKNSNFIAVKKSMLCPILILFIILSSCKKENRCDCFKGTGKVITETRSPSDFTRVELHDNINLVITQDTINTISVAGGEKLLSNIQTEFTDNKLIIQNNNKCNWVRSYKNKFTVYLHAKNLKRMELFGSGSITSTNTLAPDTLTINCWNSSGKIDITVNTQVNFLCINTGSAELYVKGNTNYNYLYNASNGFAHLEYLHTVSNTAKSISTGECYINVDQNLDATINYIGNIYYYGNPADIKTNITGEGKLIKLN
jgi:hypothetical protein